MGRGVWGMVGVLTPQDHLVNSAVPLVTYNSRRVESWRSQNLRGQQDFRGLESRLQLMSQCPHARQWEKGRFWSCPLRFPPVAGCLPLYSSSPPAWSGMGLVHLWLLISILFPLWLADVVYEDTCPLGLMRPALWLSTWPSFENALCGFFSIPFLLESERIFFIPAYPLLV